MLRAAARIQSNLLCKFINSGSMAQATLSCRYAAIHLVYLGIYTREEKMCPQDAVFLRDSLESVVSSERLFGKRSFSDNLCFDFAKHGRPKVPVRKLSPSESMKTEVHAPGFHAFGLQMLFHTRCRATALASRKRT